MDLWIRSQNKEVLTKVNDIQLDIFIGEKWKIKCNLDTRISEYYLLGIYKSKKRVLEILNEIQNILKDSQYGYKVNGLGKKVDITPNQIIVYEMPKE